VGEWGVGCGVWGEERGSGGVGKWGCGEVGSGEVGVWGSGEAVSSPYHPKTLSPQNPITPKPYHPIS